MMTMTRLLGLRVLLNFGAPLAFLSTFSACAIEAESDGGTKGGSESVAENSAAILNSSPQFWSQGSAPVLLSSDVTNSVCFLTLMSGKFRGFGESIKVVRDDTGAGHGNVAGWYLQGSSSQVGVLGAARCIAKPFVNWSWEFSSSNDIYGGNVTLGNYKACFITRVEGDFEGGSERIQLVNKYNGNAPDGSPLHLWTLETEYASAGGVRAGAICVDTGTDASSLYEQTAVGGVHAFYRGVSPDSTSPGLVNGGAACFLTHVQGKFSGGGEYIETYKYTYGLPSTTDYMFTMQSSQPGMAGGGACVVN
jgi:hypothetical protein